jgi:hypothetical protein
MVHDLTEHPFKSKPCLRACAIQWHVAWCDLTKRCIAKMPLRAAILIAVVSLGSGCTQFPDLDSAVTDTARDAPFPDLLPVEELNARLTEPRITAETASNLDGRVAALKARAAGLRRSVIDSPTRERMSIGVSEG